MTTESERTAAGLTFTEYRPGDTEAPVLILLHSMTFSRRTWVDTCRILGERFRCFAIDLPGHGDSARTGRFLTIPDMAESIADLMDSVGIESAVVVGNSMGATIGVALANQYPARVHGLVLVGAAVWASEPDRRAWLKSRARLFASDGSAIEPGPAIVEQLFGMFDEDRYQLVLSDHRRAADSLEMSTWALYSYDTAHGLAGVRQRVLAIFGSNDPYLHTSRNVLREHTRQLDEVDVEGGSHVLPVDKAVEVAAALTNWLVPC